MATRERAKCDNNDPVCYIMLSDLSSQGKMSGGEKKSHTTSILNFNSTRADQVEKCLPWRQQEGVGGWIRPLSNILYNIEQAHLVVCTKMV